MSSTFTIDGFDPEHVLERLAPVVTRDVLESVIAAAEGETLHFIETTAVISGDKLRPDADGNYHLGQIGWCFVETDRWGWPTPAGMSLGATDGQRHPPQCTSGRRDDGRG